MLALKSSRARIVAVIAATVIALACGTNYVYSAWAPQFAKRLKLSSTESNLIGTFANIGNYATGIPFGILIDARGPRWGVAVGIALFAVGYYPLAKAFDAGPGVFSVAILCIFYFFTGAGSASAFSAAIKAAALNFPDARGTATAFPLSAYGLSASFFATVALALPHDTSHFLLLLACGTVILPLVAFPFLQTPVPQNYRTVPSHEVRSHSGGIRLQPSSRVAKEDDDSDETASLFSATSADAMADFEVVRAMEEDAKGGSATVDIRGIAVVHQVEFWQLFSMLGVLAGIGLMTINNIGNDTTALWKRYDPTVTDAFVAKRQVTHVSTLSICSFSGRLLSGIGSDILVNRFHKSRLWCLFASASLFAIAQLIATFVEMPDFLVLVAAVTGIAYGMLFGVYPSLIAHAFGVHGLSQNWGTMCLGPMIGGNIFNILYGRIYDSHSVIDENGDRQCLEGRECYSKAYLVSWTASLIGLAICGWSIYYEKQKQMRSVIHDRAA